jgi:cell division protein FtsI (penicillin-binding protein 3)
MSENARKPHPARIAAIILIVVLWLAAIAFRLVQLQIFQHEEFRRLSVLRQQITSPIPAPRGIIYDRRMNELARNVPVSTVIAEPRRISDIDAVANKLSGILGLDPAGLKARMQDPDKRAYLVIKRRIDPRAEGPIAALKVNGIYLEEGSMRVYPDRELASHVLGFVNMNGDGGAGLELQYDKELEGADGLASFDVDANRRSFRGEVLKPPVQGRSLVLSLDRDIQYIAEHELTAAVGKYRAAAGTVIVMETETGRLLALANRPCFNSNTYKTAEAGLWRNRAVSDLFEPGSTFKVVVATSALEQHLTRPDELIDCQMGSIRIGGHIFHDHHPYGLLTFSQVLERSSNVGAAKLGMRLGQERLHAALLNFGFGSRTGIDLPAEIVGLVRDWRAWSGLSIGAISFGQEVGVTSIQMITAINVIASGGYRVWPHLVDRVIDSNGELIRVSEISKTRIVSPETASAVSSAFEGVILRGTAKGASLEGYRAAGKTGTAQKIVNGQYSSEKYLSSFIGYAPLPTPRITILVQIDEPKGAIYGGTVAAPVFQQVAQRVLIHLRIPPDRTLPPPKPDRLQVASDDQDFTPGATPVAPILAAEDAGAANGQSAIVVRVAEHPVEVPDFLGMSKRKVIAECQELGIRMQATGSGLAVQQFPAAGTIVSAGESCNVTFARAGAGRGRRDAGNTGSQLAQTAESGGRPASHP